MPFAEREPVTLAPAWSALGKRVAVAAGCIAALIALFRQESTLIAVLSGAATWFVLAAMTSLCAGLLAGAERSERAASDQAKKERRTTAGPGR